MDSEREAWVKEAIIEADSKSKISKVLSIDTKDVVPKGNNFVSDIFRMVVKVSLHSGETEERSLIYKVVPKTEEGKMPGIVESGVFDVETMMYADILPKLEERLHQCLPEADPLWPRLYAKMPNNEGLVMEDIAVSGFKMGNKLKGLDLEHVKLTLQNLARFHALGAVQIARGKLKLDWMDNTYLLFKLEHMVKEMTEKPIFNIIKVIEEHWKGEWLEYVPALKELQSNVLERLLQSFQEGESKFCSINHGDLWTNNLLFKYDAEGKVQNVKMLDWQFAFRSQPCYDLQHFFTTTLREEDLDEKPELLRLYYDCLVRDLKLFDFPGEVPTFDCIKDCYELTRLYGLVMVIGMRPFMWTADFYELLEKHMTGEANHSQACLICIVHGPESVANTIKRFLKEARASGLL